MANHVWMTEFFFTEVLCNCQILVSIQIQLQVVVERCNFFLIFAQISCAVGCFENFVQCH